MEFFWNRRQKVQWLIPAAQTHNTTKRVKNGAVSTDVLLTGDAGLAAVDANWATARCARCHHRAALTRLLPKTGNTGRNDARLVVVLFVGTIEEHCQRFAVHGFHGAGFHSFIFFRMVHLEHGLVLNFPRARPLHFWQKLREWKLLKLSSNFVWLKLDSDRNTKIGSEWDRSVLLSSVSCRKSAN